MDAVQLCTNVPSELRSREGFRPTPRSSLELPRSKFCKILHTQNGFCVTLHKSFLTFTTAQRSLLRKNIARRPKLVNRLMR